MKSLQPALLLTLALILPLGDSAMAASSTPGYSVTTQSRSSHSSQKSSRSTSSKKQFGSFNSKAKPAAPTPAPADPAPAPSRRGSFGAFGSGAAAGSVGTGAAPAGVAPGRSAMARDLEQSQSQANALNTLDARRNAASRNAGNGNAGQPLPPLNDRVPGVDRAPQQPYGPAPAPYGQQQPYTQPPPVVLQQGSGNSGLGAALMGFMLGRSMSASAHHGDSPGNSAANGPAAQQNGQATPNGQAGTVSGAPAAAPAPPSSFGTVLRTFAWLVLLGAIGWGIFFVVRALKRGKSRRSGANYSFERD